MPPLSSRIAVLILLTACLGFFAVKGVEQVRQVNDFEVFYSIGEAAAERATDLYERKSPIKQRGPFLYPPSAAVTFIPLSWFSHDVAGTMWALLKVVVLAGLYYGAVRFAGVPPASRFWTAPLMLLIALITIRQVNNDVGNGQINVFITGLGVAGIWLMMRRSAARTGAVGGALLLALGAAIKMTPILLVAIPLLHRRWTAFAATLVFTVLFVVVVPSLWFGGAGYRSMQQTHSEVMRRFLTESKDRHLQLTINEFVQFTVANARSSPDGLVFRDRQLFRVGADGSEQVVRLDDAMSSDAAFRIWFAIGLAAGILYLVGRPRLFGGVPPPWTWDLAVLCTLLILLVPQTRKAHYVILIVPIAWLCCRFATVETKGTIRALRDYRCSFGLTIIGVLGLLTSNDLAIPVPGFPIPYHPANLIAAIALLGALVAFVPEARRQGGELLGSGLSAP